MESLQSGHDGRARGKLIWAGRAWAKGGLVQGDRCGHDALVDECLAFGIDPAALGRAAVEEEGIWPDHVLVVQAFLAVADQWRLVAGQAGIVYLALDYTAVKAGFEMAGIRLTPAQWGDVQLIESGACAALNEA